MVLIEDLAGIMKGRDEISAVVWDQELHRRGDRFEAVHDGGGDAADVLAGQRRYRNGSLVDGEQPLNDGRFRHVDLVEHEDLRDSGRSDLVQHVANGGDLSIRIGISRIDDVNQQIGIGGLVQR